MWFKDRGGSLINSAMIVALYTTVDPNVSTAYVVEANIPDSAASGGQTLVAIFSSDPEGTMTLEQAEALLDQMGRLLAVFDPAS